MKKKLIAGIMLLVLTLNQFSFVSTASEDTINEMLEREAETQAAISDLQKQSKETKEAISALEGQKQQTQQSVSNLESQKSTLQSTINGYSSKLETLNEEISEAEDAMAEVSSEIVRLNNELSEAQQQERDRYELLKKRLKSTYESGGTSGLLRVLLESGSIGELLTKFEYLNAIVRYDRQKMAEYQGIQAQIEAQKAAVEEKEAEIDAYQNQLDEKHEELSNLTDEVRGQLDSTKSSLSSEKNKLSDYNTRLKELDDKMKALEAQTAAAQAKLAQQLAERLALTKEDTSGSYSASENELIWLAATIQAEADGESYTGKLGVGSVIMNRVKSSAFPNSVIGVITQPMQFAPYRSGKVEFIISNGPNSTCLRAAQEVLDGARVGDYLFFMTKYWADYYRIVSYTMIGNHAFFYRWETYDPPEEESAPEEVATPVESDEASESQEYSEESSESSENQEEYQDDGESSESQENTEGGE
jgi:peptidoglycan hydrolase CwlO-like protein